MSSSAADPQVIARKHWMSVLAKADYETLARHWAALDMKPDYRFVRQPETGLVMVRGRAGGTGGQFNLGEMTVTRCAIVLEDGVLEDGVPGDGPMGQAYVAGRDHGHVEIAAVLDAMLQKPELNEQISRTVIGPLEGMQKERRRERGAKSAATTVDFFTMVRGED